MQEEKIREALNAHWHASAAGDLNAEHDIYDDDAICDYPQSGESICRHCGVITQISHRVSMSGEFKEKVISGSRNTLLPIRGERHAW